MNWLITGACGFIGTNLIAHLLKKNQSEKIRVVDNLSVGKRENLARVCDFCEKARVESQQPSGELDRMPPVELIVGDIRDADLALKVGRGIDVMVHLAANPGVMPSIENPRFDCEINILGTLNYLESARINGVKRFIFASSGAPLGEQEPPIHEEKVPKPVSPYGASKLAGEGYCKAYHGSFGLKTLILRFGNVYGPRSKHKNSVIAKFIKQALNGEPLIIYGNGNQTRDFLYTEDLIDAVMAAASIDCAGETFQIATSRETKIHEIAMKIKELVEDFSGKPVQIVNDNPRDGEIIRSFFDISKSRNILGWEPKWTLEQGLHATVSWFISEDKKSVVK